jgi:acyl carrier protein
MGLDFVELIMAVEEEFKIAIADAEFVNDLGAG